MSDLSELYSKKVKYNNLKSDVDSYIVFLESAIENLESVNKNIDKYYLYDDVNLEIDEKINKLNNHINVLKNTIYPKIIKQIKEVNEQIFSSESI